MRLCLPARMGGGGKAESSPLARASGRSPPHGGGYSALGTRGQSPWRSRQSENGAGQAPPAAMRHRPRHPRMTRRRRMPCWRAQADTGVVRSAQLRHVRESVRPAGVRQGEKRECLRVSSITPHPQERSGKECDAKEPRSFYPHS
jgi:hypothetical protein